MTEETPNNFLEDIIQKDLASGKTKELKTRFPPEPNGYLHIGHAKSISLNFGLAQKFGGKCNLRMDDTNPEKEETEYVDSIKSDIEWLGFEWDGEVRYASDYFEKLYEFAQNLIRDGKAYICSLNLEQIREYRGTVKEAGRPSPDRERPAEESLDLLERMRHGEFEEGTYTLRAKIDMANSNMKMRDPLMYRIRRIPHHRLGDAWNIYPMYDFAHGLSDAIENISHSICTLEFENNRELYDWFVDNVQPGAEPHQYEFARLNLAYTVMSKRKLLQLVNENHVNGWDDPRMPTISGMRRRGYPAAAIRDFCDRIGIARRDNLVDVNLLEFCVRNELNSYATRRMGVINPVKVVVENWEEGKVDMLEGINNPNDENSGTREIPFTKEFYIEREDFMIDPPRKFFRLGPDREVRLRFAYLVTCTGYELDEKGDVSLIKVKYDPESRGGNAADGRKVKGTIHWVSCEHAVPVQCNLYDRLFKDPVPESVAEGQSFLDNLNPDSLEIRTNCWAEPAVKDLPKDQALQFERVGYFCFDSESQDDKLILNRTVTLRDTWAKLQ